MRREIIRLKDEGFELYTKNKLFKEKNKQLTSENMVLPELKQGLS
jgi:hypothetical protein